MLMAALPFAGLAQNKLQGKWAGGTDVLGSNRLLQVRFEQSGGAATGSMDIPGANAMRLPLKNISFAEGGVAFDIETPRGLFSFAGKLNGEQVAGVITGPFNAKGSLYFTKTYEAADKLLASYAGKYQLGNNQAAFISYNSLNSLDMVVIDEGSFTILREVKLFPLSDTEFMSARTVLAKPGSFRETLVFKTQANNGPPGFIMADSEGKCLQGNRVETNYAEEQVVIDNAGIQIGGTLFLPKGKTRLTALNIMHGAGPRIRTNLLVMLRARMLAEQHGIAVLVCDKRGTAHESGSEKQPSFTDLASDANAALAYLKRRSEIDPEKTGLMAASHSAWAFPIAAQAGLARFGIVVSGSPLSNEAVSTFEIETQLRQNKFSEQDISDALAFTKLKWQYALTGNGWMEYEKALQVAATKKWFNYAEGPVDNEKAHWERMELCPREDRTIKSEIQKISIPLLLLFGGDNLDDRIPVTASMNEWQAILATMPRADYTIKNITSTGHGFFFKTSNGKIVKCDEAFNALTDWLRLKKLVE